MFQCSTGRQPLQQEPSVYGKVLEELLALPSCCFGSSQEGLLEPFLRPSRLLYVLRTWQV